MEPIYYYLRDKNGAPRVTVCLFPNKEHAAATTKWSRGISIASMSETSVIRKKGRGIALSRALVAINKNLICPIVTARPMIILQNINFPEEGKFPVDWKGEYPCKLTRFEENLVMKASKGGQ